MDIQPLMPWLSFVAILISVGSSVTMFLTSGARKNGEKIDAQDKKLIEHDRRIQTVENEMRHLPNKDTVNKLQVDMTDLKGQISLIAKSSEATERATRRVEEFLLRHNN